MGRRSEGRFAARPDAPMQDSPGVATAGDPVWRRMTRRLLLKGMIGGATVLLAGPPGRPASGAEHGAPAEVKGTALGSGPTPTSPPAPMAGLTILLLPRSDSLLEELERARLHSRDSLAAYRAAIPDLWRGAAWMRRLPGSGPRGKDPTCGARRSTRGAASRCPMSPRVRGSWSAIGHFMSTARLTTP